ncbi:MAG: pyridoxamine 5'-phosphate oxidase [Bacteroidales bacterium]|nr:pyridoxamine 5'-phosphate oxidase [Bacteroidales bacterium]
MDLGEIRKDFGVGELMEDSLIEDPMALFELWLNQAIKTDPDYATAMNISTVGKDGMPSSRIVLLKGYDHTGFKFFTSYSSKKGQEISGNSLASILFFWKESERQIRIEGTIEKISLQKSIQYYYERPRESQLSALISPQSEIIPNREFLEKSWDAAKKKYIDEKIPFPEDWGGYVLKPMRMEFWQGRAGRLHDRILFKELNGHWNWYRLAP